NERRDATDDHVFQARELVLDNFPRRGWTAGDERLDDIERELETLHDDLAVRPERLHDLRADLRPGNAEHAQRQLAKLRQRQSLRNVNALQRSGEPVDQTFLQVREEVCAEVHEAELGGLDRKSTR